jgi:hypothetical protein
MFRVKNPVIAHKKSTAKALEQARKEWPDHTPRRIHREQVPTERSYELGDAKTNR